MCLVGKISLEIERCKICSIVVRKINFLLVREESQRLEIYYHPLRKNLSQEKTQREFIQNCMRVYVLCPVVNTKCVLVMFFLTLIQALLFDDFCVIFKLTLIITIGSFQETPRKKEMMLGWYKRQNLFWDVIFRFKGNYFASVVDKDTTNE